MKEHKTWITCALLHFFVFCSSGQSFSEGYIIDNSGDSIEVTFLSAKKKRIAKQNNFSFVDIITEDDAKRLYPKDIQWYEKNETIYKSFITGDTTLFAKLVTRGRAELYYSNKYSGKYYFKKRGDKFYHVINSNLETVYKSEEDQSGANGATMKNVVNPVLPDVHSNEAAFKEFFILYFKSNQAIVNKLKHGFYDYSMIEAMFREFNKE